MAELSNNRTGGNGVHVEAESETFIVSRSRSPQNLEFGHFTLLFGRVRRRNVPKYITHVQILSVFVISVLLCEAFVAVAVVTRLMTDSFGLQLPLIFDLLLNDNCYFSLTTLF